MAGRDLASVLRARAKIALPVIILAMLASIFLLASNPNAQSPLGRFGEAASDAPQAQNLRLSSTTDAGDAFEITATHAELQGDKIALRRIRAALSDSKNATTRVAARSGETNMTGERTWLFGDVKITFPSGLAVHTQALEIDTTRDIIRAPGAVHGQTAFGRLNAGSAEVDMKSEKFYFRDDVHLIYQQQHRVEDPE